MINATQTQVNREIRDFNNWKNWYPAFQNENVGVIHNPAKPGIINSVSLKYENGKQINLNLIESKTDTLVVAVESLSSTKVNYQFILTDFPNGQTQLIWKVNASLGWYPWSKLKGIFLDKISGPQYEEALKNLKQDAEK
ncbi:MAG: hypothetical protein Q8891_11945 [Bacteroidota bacterium]|nr:hypothetical protein [Bacteroidota bacterium]